MYLILWKTQTPPNCKVLRFAMANNNQLTTHQRIQASPCMPSHHHHHSRVSALLISLMAIAACLTAAASASTCQRQCGGVDIPYPFGINGDQPGCASYGLNISCNDTGNGVYRPFIWDVELRNVSLLEGQVRILMSISSYCYNTTSHEMDKPDDSWWWSLDFTVSPYRFSDSRNKFIVIGCQTLAFIGGSNNQTDVGSLTTGCVATCKKDDLESLTNGSSCSGIGCCETAIPRGLQYYQVWFDERFNTTSIYNMSRCSYAALMENSVSFEFNSTYVTTSAFNDSFSGQVPLILDWTVGNETCEQARRKNDESYACKSSNSECFDSPSGLGGYICNCTKGFKGNPYLKPEDPDSCQDINECEDDKKIICHGICRNTAGGFVCSCPSGTRGNASIEQCQKELTHGVILAIGLCTATFVGLLVFALIEWTKYKRRIIRQDLINKKDAYFRQHGGQLLIDMMKMEGHNSVFKLYDKEEIELATNNFNESEIIGEGGQGTVYKGYDLDPDNNPVAMKRCKGFDENRRMEFGQELLILSRVRHEYIVKLLGCCLQFEVPVLVYEFVPNKTLYYLIHDQNEPSIRTLDIRLKIAAESAEALAHLHSLDQPIFHGDVKSANILLGDNFIAKVSDFGCSKFRTVDDDAIMVKGTMGYLDPEYLLKFQLTDKSDVYSFGVVLLELLTRRKPLSRDKVTLTSVFQEALKEGCLVELLDNEIVHEDNMGMIHELTELASQCLGMDGERRPTMSHVAEILRRLADSLQQLTESVDGIRSLNLLRNTSAVDSSESGYSQAGTSGCYSIKRTAASMSLEYAR